jgi:uncharacterized protein YqgV (UPF0045/DUF77 family)
MKFSDAGKILSTIEYGNNVEWVRSNNRRKVNDGFNGVPPLAPADAEKMGMKINFNSGEMAVLGQQARRQYGNAFGKPSNFFKVKLPTAPPEIRMDWETTLTRLINRPLKDSLGYFETQRETFASVVAHGIGPVMWLDEDNWEPEMVALEDLRVPTDTRTNLKNLTWFALRKKYTVGELTKKAMGKDSDDGWKKPQVISILKEYADETTQVTDSTVYENPEYWADLIKQNGGFYTSDASPSIPLWHFYFTDDKGKWFLRVVPARECRGADGQKFVFDNGETEIAPNLRQLLHVQFGDLNSKAPFLWHSVRSLGFLLKEPCFWLDIMRNRVMSHCMENMNIGFRVSNPADRGRVQKLQLMDKFVLDSSIQIIPNTERHQIDAGLIETTMAQLKQLQGEASVSFTQDLETGGSNKEMTATETMARVSQVNALMSGLILTAVTYAKFQYKEIARRFTKKDTENEDAKEFQMEARRAGIPPQFIDSKNWDIEPEVPLGSGNPTMEMAQAQALMQVRSLHTPQAQDAILHMYDEAVTGDANIAEYLAPTNQKPLVTDAVTAAQFAFPVLMQGVPVRMPERLNPVEQITTLMGMLSASIAPIMEGQQMPTMRDVIGFGNAITYISSLLERVGQDEQMMPFVTEVSGDLGELTNAVKQMEREVMKAQEEAGQSGGMTPEAQAKILDAGIVAQTKSKISEATAAQKMGQKQQQFQANEARKDAQTAAEIQRKLILTKVDAVTTPRPEEPVASSQ